MKSTTRQFISKVAWITGFTILGCSAMSKCEAQSIVGKWNAISTTIYYSDEGSARTGMKIQVTTLADMGVVTMEFYSSHTFKTTTSVINDPKVNTLEGTWTFTGDQLNVTVDPKYHPVKGHESKTSTILITGNTLLITENTPPTRLVNKMVTKYQKI